MASELLDIPSGCHWIASPLIDGNTTISGSLNPVGGSYFLSSFHMYSLLRFAVDQPINS